MNNDTSEVLLNMASFKKKFNIRNDKTITKYVKLGLPHIKIGNKYMFNYNDCLMWFKEMSKDSNNG